MSQRNHRSELVTDWKALMSENEWSSANNLDSECAGLPAITGRFVDGFKDEPGWNLGQTEKSQVKWLDHLSSDS